jgi:K+-transporting ATPase ATPase A chain
MGVEHGTNLEGKEVRIGVMPSVLWSVITTDTSTGAVDSMHDSMTPIPGLIQIFNMAIGEAIFGGVGSGLMMMIFYALITMFIAGLMIGRTPEFLGKKLGPYEMVMASIGLLSSPITLLIFSAIAISLPAGLSALTNHGPHGLSEILYAYASTANNNGSAFAGLNSNTLFYNLTLGFAMLLGRFTTLIPGLAVAGSLAKKRLTPGTAATLRSDTLLFVVMLIGVVIVVGALTFLPPLTLGPFLEQLMMHAGRTF